MDQSQKPPLVLNVKDYGAVGNNTADDTAAIQAAVTAASVAANALFFPAGTYKTTAPINIPITGGLRIFGAGKTLSVIRGHGTFASIFNIGTNAAQTIRGCFQDLQCSGQGATIQYGIYGSRVEEHDFERVSCWNFTVAGFSIGYGYCNNYLDCEASYNTGNGFEFNTVYGSGGNNANTLVGCLALANSGWGLKAVGGTNLDVVGCTIEVNDIGGILLNNMSSVRIKAYFENNGVTGIAYTTPAVTVKADIVVNGSANDTDMDNSFPCVGVVIEGCNTAPLVTSNAFVWNAGAVDMSIRGCFTNHAAYVPLVAQQYRPAYKGYNLVIENCSTFTTQISETGATSAVNNTPAAFQKITCPSLNIEVKNYAVTDQNLWASIAGSGAVTYRRSTNAALYRMRNADVWEMASGSAGSTFRYGVSLTATDYPELVGKMVWYGLWVYSTDADCYAVPYCNQQGFNVNPTTLSTWTFLAVSFVWPASLTVDIGVYKSGSNTGSVFFAAPMLCRVGVTHEEAIGLIPRYTQWRGTAAPVAGTWEQGDVVVNSAPTVGQPQAWACTTAGTPGTWTALGAGPVRDDAFSVVGSSDATKALKFEVDAQTAGKTLTLNTGAQTVDRTLTVPVIAGNRTLAVIDQAQTFTAAQTFSSGIVFANETLSTYDEGTWVPTIFGSGTAGTPTYVVQTGHYVRIGSLVLCHGFVYISAKTGIAGNISIGGLPFPLLAGTYGAATIGAYEGFTLASSHTQLTAYAAGGDSSISIGNAGSGQSSNAITDAGIDATTFMYITFVYRA